MCTNLKIVLLRIAGIFLCFHILLIEKVGLKWNIEYIFRAKYMVKKVFSSFIFCYNIFFIFENRSILNKVSF